MEFQLVINNICSQSWRQKVNTDFNMTLWCWCFAQDPPVYVELCKKKKNIENYATRLKTIWLSTFTNYAFDEIIWMNFTQCVVKSSCINFMWFLFVQPKLSTMCKGLKVIQTQRARITFKIKVIHSILEFVQNRINLWITALLDGERNGLQLHLYRL